METLPLPVQCKFVQDNKLSLLNHHVNVFPLDVTSSFGLKVNFDGDSNQMFRVPKRRENSVLFGVRSSMDESTTIFVEKHDAKNIFVLTTLYVLCDEIHINIEFYIKISLFQMQ